MTEPITITLPLWQWVVVPILLCVGYALGQRHGQWLSGARGSRPTDPATPAPPEDGSAAPV